MKTKKVYTYGTKKVEIENGKVVRSDTTLCKMGEKPNIKALRACGWRLEKSPKPQYVKGQNGRPFTV